MEPEILQAWLNSTLFESYLPLFLKAGYDMSTISRMTPEEPEILQAWLSSIQFESYLPLFLKAGYDMPTISRMTPEDLTAIGITKPCHRSKLKSEIQKLNISDGIPNYRPDSLMEWLKLLRLDEYYVILCQQGYDSIDRVAELTWEDLEEIGIKRLGHQKRLALAIKRIRDLNQGITKISTGQYPAVSLKQSNESFSSSSSSSTNNRASVISSSSSLTSTSSSSSCLPPYNYQLSVKGDIGQVVPIQTNTVRSKVASEIESPTTPELKTFQQLPSTFESNRNFHSPANNGRIDNINSVNLNNMNSVCSNGSNIGAMINNNNGLSTHHNNNGHASIYRHYNQIQFYGLQSNGEQNSLHQSTRGRSLESIDREDYCNKALIFSQQRHQSHYVYNNNISSSNTNHSNNNSNYLQQQQQFRYRQYNRHCSNSNSGYETDSEVINNRKYDMNYVYEVDGTATLNRPKGLLKNKPIAKIAAKSRQTNDNIINDTNESLKSYDFNDVKFKDNKRFPLNIEPVNINCCNTNNIYSNSCENSSLKSMISNNNSNNKLNYISQSTDQQNYQVYNNYNTLKKKNPTPPPPPKRTNSMKSASSTGSHLLRRSSMDSVDDLSPDNDHCDTLEAMQEQAFATCVKSLASRFRINSDKDEEEREKQPPIPVRNHSITPRVTVLQKSDDDFPPPPPSPLLRSEFDDYNEFRNDEQNDFKEINQKATALENNVNIIANNNSIDNNNKQSAKCNQDSDEKVQIESAMSSSSSSESMPFANDNIGTIKQKSTNSDLLQQQQSKSLLLNEFDKSHKEHKTVFSAPSSLTSSPFATILRKPKSNYVNSDKISSNGLAGSKQLVMKLPIRKAGNTIDKLDTVKESNELNDTLRHGYSEPTSPSTLSQSTETVIDDIELMLANLSNQLDAILESELQSD